MFNDYYVKLIANFIIYRYIKYIFIHREYDNIGLTLKDLAINIVKKEDNRPFDRLKGSA